MKLNKTLLLLLCLWETSIPLCKAQIRFSTLKVASDTIIYSKHLGYDKEYTVYTPYNMNPDKKYPILIHFDEELTQTKAVISDIDKLSSGGIKQIPKMVVVTIKSKYDTLNRNSRALEVLLPEMEEVGSGISKEELKTARGKELDRFLFEELLPHLEKQYPIDRKQLIFAGHSYYGYFTGYLFKEHINEVFAVISNSPYFVIGKVNIKAQLQTKLAKLPPLSHRTYFYTGVGGEAQGDDRVGWSSMDALLTTAKLPEKLSYKGFDYPHSGHNAVPILTTGRALCEIYAQWAQKGNTNIQKRWSGTMNEDEIKALDTKIEAMITEYYGVNIPYE